MESQNNETGCCKSCNPWKGIAILLIILVAAGAAYYFGTLKSKTKTDNTTAKQTEVTTPANTNTTSSDTTGTTQSSVDKYPGWSTLTDTKMGYTLRFPTTWTAKIEDGTTDPNYPGSQKNYHYLSLAPSGQKWDLNIGIVKKDDQTTATSLRTGIGPVGIKTNGEIIKIAGSDVQIVEYVDNGKITEMFFGYAMGGSNTINNGKHKFSGYFSYYGIYSLDKNGSPIPDASNTTTRTSEPYLTVKKILESIEFTAATEKSSTSASSTIYKNEKYGFQVTAPSGYKVLDDKNSLYGYPNGIALIMSTANGAQSQDVTIEIWDTEAQYKEKYTGWAKKEAVDGILSELIAKTLNGKIITFYGGNKNGMEKKVAATFKAN